MERFLEVLTSNPLIVLICMAIALDTFLGLLRAIKERKFNSSVGINGGIRKTAMIISIIALCFADSLIDMNLLFMIPEQVMKAIGLKKIGLSEFFSLLFSLYECASILKNMVLCGLPVPKKLKDSISKFLMAMTDEMPKQNKKEE
ncbi:MAG: phage holin family protein [Clostridiales bacterium]|nr:phage holin family protein [Clostridiales bacterium]